MRWHMRCELGVTCQEKRPRPTAFSQHHCHNQVPAPLLSLPHPAISPTAPTPCLPGRVSLHKAACRSRRLSTWNQQTTNANFRPVSHNASRAFTLPQCTTQNLSCIGCTSAGTEQPRRCADARFTQPVWHVTGLFLCIFAKRRKIHLRIQCLITFWDTLRDACGHCESALKPGRAHKRILVGRIFS